MAGRMWASGLPWVGLLGLLGLKQNRRAAAWWIWLPVFASLALTKIFQTAAYSMGSDASNLFSDLIWATGLAVGSLWLIAGGSSPKNRLVQFLISVLILAGYGLFTFLCSTGGDDSLVLPACVMLGVIALVLSTGMIAAGWLGRRTQQIWRLLLWLLVCLLATVAMAFTLFLLAMLPFAEESLPWKELGIGILLLGGFLYVILLPYLLLAMGSPFYGARLKKVLGWEREINPPVVRISPVPLGPADSPGNLPQIS